MFAIASFYTEDNYIDASLELTDNGVVLAAKIKITLSLILDPVTTLKNS
jgi:hypothetical protein